jgi:hypothetical protein
LPGRPAQGTRPRHHLVQPHLPGLNCGLNL